MATILAVLLVFGSLTAVPALAQERDYDLHDNVILYSQQGEAYMERQEYDHAVNSFLAALKLNPFSNLSASIYNNLGLSYHHLGHYSLALASFQHAARIQPNYELYYKNMINSYAAGATLFEAQDQILGIIADNPDNAELTYILALMALELNQKKEASAYFERYLTLVPHSYLSQAANHHLIRLKANK